MRLRNIFTGAAAAIVIISLTLGLGFVGAMIDPIGKVDLRSMDGYILITRQSVKFLFIGAMLATCVFLVFRFVGLLNCFGKYILGKVRRLDPSVETDITHTKQGTAFSKNTQAAK